MAGETSRVEQSGRPPDHVVEHPGLASLLRLGSDSANNLGRTVGKQSSEAEHSSDICRGGGGGGR